MTYSETYFLSAGETNAESELSLTQLTSRIIDIATAHANSLGIGNPDMPGNSAGWVLSRLTIQMDSYPEVNTRYILTTWIESWNRHFSERCFSVSSEDGRIYGYARSVWMVMDTITRTNVGLSHLSLPENAITGQGVPVDRQKRHFPIVCPGSITDGSAPKGAVEATDGPVFHKFGYSDLDAYRHVNTVRYVALLLNQFSLEDLDRTMIRRLELSFMKEIRISTVAAIMRRDNHEKMISDFFLADRADNTPLLFCRITRSQR